VHAHHTHTDQCPLSMAQRQRPSALAAASASSGQTESKKTAHTKVATQKATLGSTWSGHATAHRAGDCARACFAVAATAREAALCCK